MFSVSLGFDAALLSDPHSPCQSFPAWRRACRLSAPLAEDAEGPPTAAGQRLTCKLQSISTVRGTEKSGEARGNNDGVFSGLVCSKGQETTKRSLPCPTAALAHGSGSARCPCFLCVLCFCAQGLNPWEVADERLKPPGHQLHQAVCEGALNICTSSHPPQPVLMPWHPWQGRTPL